MKEPMYKKSWFFLTVKFYVESPKDYFEEFLKEISKEVNEKILELSEITQFYYKKETLVSNLLDGEEIDEDVYPLLLYVSASPNEYDDIGLLIFKERIEYFEGNEDVTSQTNQMVGLLMGEGDKEVKIYGNHGKKVVDFINKTGKLPEGLYVSPNKNHALSHWDMKEDRYLISGYIKLKDVNRESDVDWKTNSETEIKKIRII